MTRIERSARPATARPQPGAAQFLSLALPYLLAAYIAYVFLWYLPFKFEPESYLFQIIEDWAGLDWVEPKFRYLTGGVEALACLLLVVPRLQVAGAALAFATMAGAIGLHVFTPLGIDPYEDGGRLFSQACTCLVFAGAILALRRHEILPLLRSLATDPRFASTLGGRR